MKKLRSLLALICALTLLFSSTSAFAQSGASYLTVQDALADGQEIFSSFGLRWYSPSLLDDETNAAIASLLDALSLECSTVSDENGNGYQKGAVKLSDYSVVDYEILRQDGVYCIRLLDAEPFVLPLEEMDGFLANLRAYLIRMEIFTEEEMAELQAELESAMAEFSKAMEEQAALSGEIEIPASFEEVGDKLSDWAEKALAGETVFQGGVSWYGEEAVQSVVYELTAEEIVEVLHLLGQAGIENETFASDLLSMLESSGATLSFNGEEILTLEDLNAVFTDFQAITAEDFPSEFSAVYTCYQDAESSPVFSRLVLSASDESEEASDAVEPDISKLDMNMEWSHLQTALCLNLSLDDGVDPMDIFFSVVSDPEQAEESEVGLSRASEISAMLEITVGGVTYPFSFSVASSDLEGSTVSSKDVSVSLSAELQGNQYALYGVYNQLISTISGYSSTHDATLGFAVDDTTLPIFGVQGTVEAVSPQGSGIDISSAVHPGLMTEDDFTVWMNSILISALGRVNGMTAYLPEEFLSYLQSHMISDESEAVVITEMETTEETEAETEEDDEDSKSSVWGGLN